MITDLIKNVLADSLKPLFLKLTLVLLCVFIALALVIILNIGLMLYFPAIIGYIVLVNFIISAVVIAFVVYKLKKATERKHNYGTVYLLSALALQYLKSKRNH